MNTFIEMLAGITSQKVAKSNNYIGADELFSLHSILLEDIENIGLTNHPKEVANYLFSFVFIQTFEHMLPSLGEELSSTENKVSISKFALGYSFFKSYVFDFTKWCKSNADRFSIMDVKFLDIDFNKPYISSKLNYEAFESGDDYPKGAVTIVQLFHAWFEKNICIKNEGLWKERRFKSLLDDKKMSLPTRGTYNQNASVSDIFEALMYRWMAFGCLVEAGISAQRREMPNQVSLSLKSVASFFENLEVSPYFSKFELYMYDIFSNENPLGDASFNNKLGERLDGLNPSDKVQITQSLLNMAKVDLSVASYTEAVSKTRAYDDSSKDYFKEFHMKNEHDDLEVQIKYFWITQGHLQALDIFLIEKIFTPMHEGEKLKNGECTGNMLCELLGNSLVMGRAKKAISLRFNSEYLGWLSLHYRREIE